MEKKERIGEIGRTMATIRRAARDRRAARRLLSRTWRLSSLEESMFGARMPDAAVLVHDSGWRPESIGLSCRRCGTTLARFESDQNGCAHCRQAPLLHRATVRLGPYAPPLSQWAPAIKSRAWRSMGLELGRLLGHQVMKAALDERSARPDCIVSVPVHWLRRLGRGIDHGALLAEAAGEVLGIRRIAALRATLARRQARGARSARQRNGGRFVPTRRCAEVEGLRVLLVDDVRTTGTTVAEAAEVLLRHGAAEVIVAVCAVADPPSRRSLQPVVARSLWTT